MKIICIGRNYPDHIRELNNKVPAEPVFFMKPDSAILPKKTPFFYPEFTKELHYEVEVVIRIDKVGKHISAKFAHKYYDEIGLGIDFTARDVQEECKKKGLPWEKAKAFDGSAVIGDFMHKNELGNTGELSFTLEQNGQTVQSGNTKNMIFGIDEIIAYVSRFVTLKIGDLIFTGTPDGVGPVNIGDILEGTLEGRKMFTTKIK